MWVVIVVPSGIDCRAVGEKAKKKKSQKSASKESGPESATAKNSQENDRKKKDRSVVSDRSSRRDRQKGMLV